MEDNYIPMNEQHTVKHMKAKYNPYNGFYVSRHLLTADYESDMHNLQLNHLVCAGTDIHLKYRGTDDIFRIISLRSLDGNNDTMVVGDSMAGEKPEQFTYTPAYYSSPNLKAAVDWFKCDKARIRIFRQLPGQNVCLHHDFDNERNNFSKEDITVRIITNLSDTDSYFQLINEGCDITIRLVQGQFIIINTDFVWHGTRNNDSVPRDTLNMIVKWNDWLTELTKPREVLEIEKVKLSTNVLEPVTA